MARTSRALPDGNLPKHVFASALFPATFIFRARLFFRIRA
ncbi:hypothetical protein OPIT5_07940 [Opitutaceae bacterium TAV5]|nr:hypothetical protein OPIT5_07940 [Opitutaceae bacterium TAV5]